MSKSKRRAAVAANLSAGIADVVPVNSEPVMETAVVETKVTESTAVAPENSVTSGAEVDASDIVIEDAPPTVSGSNSGAPRQNATSIRKTIREGLLAGETTDVIAAKLKEMFPSSAAAAKSSKHIAFYRSLMRKAGELPKAGVSTK